VITEHLPFQEGQSKECTVTATNILMVNCPEVSFVYNAELFIETKNKGIKDYGGETQLIGIHKVIEKTEQGKISFADPS
jgi:hypothetical protein